MLDSCLHGAAHSRCSAPPQPAKAEEEARKKAAEEAWIKAEAEAKPVSTPEGEKKLREAAAGGKTAEVERLLREGADPNGPNGRDSWFV